MVKFNVINQKNGESIVVEARNIAQAMNIARKTKGWINYGSYMKDSTLNYRYYAINRLINT